jgi:hypothetical protein
MRNAYKFFVRWEYLGVDGEDNTKTNLKEKGCDGYDWIHLTEAVMHFRVCNLWTFLAHVNNC